MSMDSLSPPPRRVGRFGAVYTSALYLVDRDGEKRGGMGFTDDGAPTMMLLDSEPVNESGVRALPILRALAFRFLSRAGPNFDATAERLDGLPGARQAPAQPILFGGVRHAEARCRRN